MRSRFRLRTENAAPGHRVLGMRAITEMPGNRFAVSFAIATALVLIATCRCHPDSNPAPADASLPLEGASSSATALRDAAAETQILEAAPSGYVLDGDIAEWPLVP